MKMNKLEVEIIKLDADVITTSGPLSAFDPDYYIRASVSGDVITFTDKYGNSKIIIDGNGAKVAFNQFCKSAYGFNPDQIKKVAHLATNRLNR